MPDELRVLPIRGLPEFRPGDDLPAAIARAAPWLADGDVVVVTSKAVSKVEGHLRTTPVDPEQRETVRRQAVLDEARRVVARHGRTTITETHHGFVLAASGVDASNVRADELALLPPDPDRSAGTIRDGLRQHLGVTVAVVVSDTMGRPWRAGLTDVAVGAAGLTALRDHRGRVDAYGNELVVTEVADADQIAAAAELVKGKLDGVPVAVVRGLRPVDDGRGAAALVRGPEQDMFRLGTRDVVGARSDTSRYDDRPVDPAALQRAVGAARTAVGTGDWRLVRVTDPDVRRRLAEAPELLVFTVARRPDPDGWLAAGAALQNLLVQLAAEGLGSAWHPLAGDERDAVEQALDVSGDWRAVGTITAGHPRDPIGARPLPDPGDHLIER